jgi:hypothetical protein
MENNIPTASEFMTDEYQIKHYGTILLKPGQAAIEFAKLHVEAALKAAVDNIDYYQEPYGDDTQYVSESSILNAYPLTLIK